MIEEKTLLTDHFNLSNREFRKKYSEGLKIIEISDGFEKSNPSFETSSTGKYIAIKSDENKYLVFYSKGTNIISENYSVISVFDLDQEIESNKIYENWVVEKPALFTLHNDGTWSMNEKGIINLDSNVEIEKLIKPMNSIIETKPLFEKIEKPEIKEEFNQKKEALIEVTNEIDAIEVESLIIKTPPKVETKTNKKVKLSSPFKLSIVAIIIWVAIFFILEVFQKYQIESLMKEKNLNAYRNLGLAYYKQGKIEDAIEMYKKAISINPNSNYAGAYRNLGLAYYKQGKIEDAIEMYKKAISINPNYVYACYSLGIAYHNQGKIEEAIEIFKKAISIDPNYADLYNNLGVIYYDQGKIEDAIEMYKKVIAINPKYANDAYNNLGNAYYKQGKIKEAIEMYKKVISNEEMYKKVISNEEMYKKVISNEADQKKVETKFDRVTIATKAYNGLGGADAYTNLGNAYKTQGKSVEAIEMYKKACELGNKDTCDWLSKNGY